MPAPSRIRVHDATVVANIESAKDTFRMIVHAPQLAATLSSGQFISIQVPGESMQLSRVPLSYVTCNFDEGTVELLYAIKGPGTLALSKMQPGDKTTILGPGGRGWKLDTKVSRVCLIAGGVGIPPIVSAAERLGLTQTSFDVIIGARSNEYIWGLDRCTRYGAKNVIVTTDDGSAGAKGFCTDALAAALPEEGYDLVLACGPEPMMRLVAQICAEHDVACQVSMERFMVCGFGACSTCTVETPSGLVGACTHGPVMDAKEVIW